MGGGLHSKTPTGYFEAESFQPWPGIDVSKPSSQIDPGACVSASGMSIRGGLTNQPAIVAPQGSNYPIVAPDFAPGEVLALATNLSGVTILITNIGVYADFSTGTATSKTFSSIFTFPTPYSQAVHFGSVVIGNNLYFSSAELLGVYELSFTSSVLGLFVTDNGDGYTSIPTVTLTGGGGTGATATATIMGAGTPGEVTSYNVAPPFGGVFPLTYWWPYLPTIVPVISGGGGTGATASIVWGTSGFGRYKIMSVTPTSFGSGYTSAPTVTIDLTGMIYVGGPQNIPKITANVSGTGGYVSSLILGAGGSGYTSPPTVTIGAPGGGGIQATGAAILGPPSGVSVSEITAHNGSGPFIGANFLATIAQRLVLGSIIGGDGNQTGIVTSATIVNGGTGYPNSGNITFLGGGGQNAAGIFAASGGVINSIVITNPGNGYNSAPTPSAVAATGSGFVGTATLSFSIGESSTTARPDYVAWSAANAYGYFDPNSVLEGGGFDQLTEARGKITGLAVFESVWFAAHLGGFTQITVNSSGQNIQPFTYNPLWSSDQGIICRFGSLAQYGAMCMFLGEDQPYQLSPGGLKAIGDSIASLVQNFSLWDNGVYPDAGLYGSIVEIEGEKHYLIGFCSDDPTYTSNTNRQTLIFDMNIKTGAWFTWNYPLVTMTCPIYQSYDSQNMQGAGATVLLDRDNLLLLGLATTVSGSVQSVLGQPVAGQQLYGIGSTTRIASEAFAYQFRSENPVIGRSQTTRGIYIEYENLPELAGTSVTLSFTLTGQPDKTGNGVPSLPISVSFSASLPNYALSSTVVPNMVLTATCQPPGSAFTALSQTLKASSSGFIRVIKLDPFGETTQGTLQ
jgi:hypothetical protein